MVQPTNELLSQAKELIRTGQKQAARELLKTHLQKNPLSEEGWWIMSFAVDNQARQIQCLEKILQINPDRDKVRAKLESLTAVKASADPGPDPAGEPATPRKKKSSWLRFAPVGIIGLIAVSLVLYLGYQNLASPPLTTQAQTALPQETAAQLSIELPPTWTEPAPTLTQTPHPTATATPAPTATPTLDPNATMTAVPESQVGTKPGKYPPDFILRDVVTGEEISVRDYVGQPVLIAFFATWCPYCQSDLPKVQTVYDEYKNEGFVVLAVGVKESESTARNFGANYSLNYPILSDPNSEVANDFQVSGYPYYYYIGKSGKIGFVNPGTIKKNTLIFYLTKP